MPKTSRRARCEAVADRLDVPRPFDLDVLCERIVAQRGRPLRLVALEGAPDSSMPCGVWVATTTADIIFYEPATSALHKLQIVLHELAHLLLGHGATDAERPAYAARLLEASSGAHRRERADGGRLPDPGAGGTTGPTGTSGAGGDADPDEYDDELDLEQLMHVLGRTSYTDNEERDAELLATILSDRALSNEAPAASGPAADVLNRLNDAFGHPIRR